jgi:hypothetical protein
VALKTVVARLSVDKGEATLLRWLGARPRDHPGANHIVQLHDSFQIHGPNGTHQVLVMDVLQSFYSVCSERAFSSAIAECLSSANVGVGVSSAGSGGALW